MYSLCTPRNQFSPLGHSRYELKAGGRGCVWHPLLESHEDFVGICLALCGLGRGCRIRIVGTIPLSQIPVQLIEEKTTGKVGLLFRCPELPPTPEVLLEEGDPDGSYRLCRRCRLFWGPSSSRGIALRFCCWWPALLRYKRCPGPASQASGSPGNQRANGLPATSWGARGAN